MKRFLIIALSTLAMLTSCQPPVEPMENLVVLPEGTIVLQDTEFGMYYGNINNDGVGRLSLILSDARCYQDKLGSPYLDSEGEMLVIQLRIPLLDDDAPIVLPEGDFMVSDKDEMNVISQSESYVTRLVGSTQSKWNIKSGSISIEKAEGGKYNIITKDLVIGKGKEEEKVDYACSSTIVVDDYSTKIPYMLGTSDDIINVPFPYLNCVYYGNLYGNGTGNFVVNMATKGFIVVNDEGVEEMTDMPGIYITLNFFSRLYSGTSQPVIEEGRYNVSTMASDQLLSRWTLFPGVLMDNTPFGSYVLQQPAMGEGAMEYITGGYVDVKYVDDETDTKAVSMSKYCIMTYSLKTSSRVISGEWRGQMPVNNQSETTADSYLTTLDHDVECDMSKVTEGSLRLTETLHRKNVEAEWDYDIAEAWTLFLAPRDWTLAEKEIPWVDEDNAKGADGIQGTEDDWMYDKNKNGVRDRLEAWCGDGDVMSLEFILPLGSQGVIAPELNKEYVYTMQPSLSVDAEMYEIYVSQMGRPADEIFDSQYAKEHPGWAEGLGITSYDRCNARRGFTWASDGYRGNWYQHYQTGSHHVLDEHAPAINGTVKIKRTDIDVYDIEWDFIDDLPGTPNKITGSIKNVKVKTYLN